MDRGANRAHRLSLPYLGHAMNAAALAALLKGAKKSGDGYTAKCPGHEDGTASLSFKDGREGVVLHDDAVFSPEALVASLGLTMKDLFTDSTPATNGIGRVVNEYRYEDESGAHLFSVLRMDPKT